MARRLQAAKAPRTTDRKAPPRRKSGDSATSSKGGSASKPVASVADATRRAVDPRAAELAIERIAREQVAPTRQAPANAGPGILVRQGRLLADGTRRGGRTLRRMTMVLPLDVADELERRARARRMSHSDLTAEVLAEAWAITLEAVS
jgi:hypothetical protein